MSKFVKWSKDFLEQNIFKYLDDVTFLKFYFALFMHQKLNLNNPTTYNEKLQWIKLYDRNPIYKTFVDKIEVKKYVEDCIGKEYVIPTYKIWDKPDEISLTELPDQFVIKCSHNSGGVVIVKDKSKANLKEIIHKLQYYYRQNYYWVGREWPYKDVCPRIICEQYLKTQSDDIIDYKVMCFEGKAHLIQIHLGRYTNHTQDFYDTDWNKLEVYQKGTPNSSIVLDRPDCLDEMIRISELLSKGYHHIRVDWYYVNGQLYFGELTLFDSSGHLFFVPSSYDKLLGDLINLEGKDD